MGMGTLAFDNEEHGHMNSKIYNVSDYGFGYANHLTLIAYFYILQEEEEMQRKRTCE